MGKPEQSNSSAVIAVIVVGMLLLLVVFGGAAILVGGLFFVSLESSPQPIMVGPELTEPMIVSDTGSGVQHLIEIDETGQITRSGAVRSAAELRTDLEQAQDEFDLVSLQLDADPNCPEEVRTEVIEICEEVLGAAPDIVEREAESPVAPIELEAETN